MEEKPQIDIPKSVKYLKRRFGADEAYAVGDALQRPARKRKHRWDKVAGRPISVRVPDSVYGRIRALAAKQGLTVSEWCKANLYRAASVLPDGAIRSHEKKGKGQGAALNPSAFTPAGGSHHHLPLAGHQGIAGHKPGACPA